MIVTESDIPRLLSAGKAVLQETGSVDAMLKSAEEYSALLEHFIAGGVQVTGSDFDELLQVHGAVIEVVSEAANGSSIGGQIERLRRFCMKAYLSQMVKGER